MAFLVMVIFYFLARGTRKFFKKVILRKVRQVSIQEIIGKVVFVTILLIGFFVALGVLELDKVLTSILAGAGVVGLAVGLALQGTLSNTFGGLVLSFMPQLKINDYIEAEGTSGFVSEINLRNITLRKPDNNMVIIPNSKFIDNAFTNYTLNKRGRITVACGVGYESSLEDVETMIIKVIKDNFKQEKDETIEFFFTEFGDSSINFVVRFWTILTNSKEELQEKHKAIKLIKATFATKGINIPFPIRTLDFGKNNIQVNMAEKDKK